jgi:hypothetical protein
MSAVTPKKDRPTPRRDAVRKEHKAARRADRIGLYYGRTGQEQQQAAAAS